MAEGVDIGRLGKRLKRVRKQRGDLTLQEVADATKLHIATLSRIERGAAKEVESATLLALASWMGTAVEEFKGMPRPVDRGNKIIEETPDIVELHLRADKKLDKKTATALGNLFRAAYDQLAKKEKA